MNKIQKSILNKIIKEEGSCEWAEPHICIKCPLSKLKKTEKGNWMSCVEAIGIDNLTEEQANAKYKAAALKLLLEDVIENMISGEDDGIT